MLPEMTKAKCGHEVPAVGPRGSSLRALIEMSKCPKCKPVIKRVTIIQDSETGKPVGTGYEYERYAEAVAEQMNHREGTRRYYTVEIGVS